MVLKHADTGNVSSISPYGIGEEDNGKPPHKTNFPRNNSEPCLSFLLRSKSSMQFSLYKDQDRTKAGALWYSQVSH